MKVLLVRPKFSSIVANLEPMGLEYIGGLLRDLNFEYEIFDEFQYSWLFRFNRLVHKIKKGGFNCIGFHANANTTDYIINASNQLKKTFKNLFIMVGGSEAELNYQDFFKDSIDFVYHDNGLDSLKNAFSCRFSQEILEQQSGVCFKMNDKWVVKEKGKPVNGFITIPDRTHFYKTKHNNFIFLKGSFAIVKASFSCPYNCSFCYCTKMNGGIYKERDIFDVLAEIESIEHRRIWLIDDTFFVDRKRVEFFCEKIIDKEN